MKRPAELMTDQQHTKEEPQTMAANQKIASVSKHLITQILDESAERIVDYRQAHRRQRIRPDPAAD
jgi:hypothetical protein